MKRFRIADVFLRRGREAAHAATGPAWLTEQCRIALTSPGPPALFVNGFAPFYLTSRGLVRRPDMQSWLKILNRFRSDERGNIALLFGLSLVPVVGAAGVAVDYGKASNMKRSPGRRW
jgi:hypothetical protein